MLKPALEFVVNYFYNPIGIKPLLKLTKVIFLLFTLLILGTKTSNAHLYKGFSTIDNLKAIPEDKLPCDQTRNPEFHSLRPYQAAPCGDSDKTLFCFNNYQIEESVSTTWSLECVDHGSYYSCPPDADDIEIEKIYSVDGEFASFPIMGNTEQVRNSQTP